MPVSSLPSFSATWNMSSRRGSAVASASASRTANNPRPGVRRNLINALAARSASGMVPFSTTLPRKSAASLPPSVASAGQSASGTSRQALGPPAESGRGRFLGRRLGDLRDRLDRGGELDGRVLQQRYQQGHGGRADVAENGLDERTSGPLTSGAHVLDESRQEHGIDGLPGLFGRRLLAQGMERVAGIAGFARVRNTEPDHETRDQVGDHGGPLGHIEARHRRLHVPA